MNDTIDKWASAQRFAAHLTTILLLGAVLPLSARCANNPRPHVESVQPISTPPGNAAVVLVVEGAGFQASSTVTWNGTAVTTTFSSVDRLIATIPAALEGNPQSARVNVENPGPGGGTSNPFYVSITNPELAISFVSSMLPTGSLAQAIAAGDFNGDGILDLAVVNSGDGTISIYMGSANGSFQQQTLDCSCDLPAAIAIGDVNNDGRQDLAIAVSGDDQANVLVFLGNGDGTFQSPPKGYVSDSPEFAYASAIAIGDFNGDGNLDLAVTNSNDGNVSILLGNGDGTFGTSQDYGTGVGPEAVVIGDFNGDGVLDLAVADTLDGSVSILLGNGDGTFETQQAIAIGQIAALAAADFNADGKIDLAVADSSANAAGVLLGNGDGTFAPVVLYDVGTSPSAVAAGDFDGDGKLDLALTNAVDGTVSILTGKGDGSFNAQSVFNAEDYPVALYAGDFNNDGRTDLAVVNAIGESISILLQPVTQLTALPSELNFGNQVVGSVSGPRSITVINTGTNTITFSAIGVTGDFRVVGGSNSGECPLTGNLAVGSSCIVNVTFTPSQTGVRVGSLSITGNANGSPQLISLMGTGISAVGGIVATPTSLIFGPQNIRSTSAAQTITVSNTGATVVSLSGLSATGDFAVSGSVPRSCTASISLSAGGSCSVGVTFTPIQTGTRNGTLTIFLSSGGSPVLVALSGTGVATTGMLVASPMALTFGPQNLQSASIPKSIMVSNTGTVAVTVGSLTINGDFSILSGTGAGSCGASLSLAANSSCTVGVVFAPTKPGASIGAVSISNSDGGSTIQVTLQGVGVDFSLSGQPTERQIHGDDGTNFVISVQSVGGAFNSAIGLSVSGLPPGLSAAFSPMTITPGSGSGSSTLRLNKVSQASFVGERLTFGRNGCTAIAVACFSLMLMAASHGVKTSCGRRCFTVLIVSLVVLRISGCAGGFPGVNPAEQAKTYSLTVRGKAGTLQHSTVVRLIVPEPK